MSGIIASVAQFIYPLRKQLHRLFNAGAVLTGSTSEMTPAKSIYDYRIEGIDGKEIDFSAYKGKKILLVNTASECGFTPQYAPLQKLHELYGERLAVVGFPSNNFGAQEPGDEDEIMNFCKTNYGVTFPLSKKVDVTGPDKNEIFQWLTGKELNGWNDREPNWNFCKYLVDESGRLTNFFSHKMDPMDPKILSAISTQKLPL
jgi:glutathione peroxidase